jgi:ABC-type branched-subunit amino acid transport system permease subunit
MRRILAVLVVGTLLAVPYVTGNPFYQHLLIMVLFWTLLGAAWNLLGGFAGQVSFGHATFLGVGAYTAMLLYLKLGWSPWLGLVFGGLAGARWPCRSGSSASACAARISRSPRSRWPRSSGSWRSTGKLSRQGRWDC